jgi:hypothetical protein
LPAIPRLLHTRHLSSRAHTIGQIVVDVQNGLREKAEDERNSLGKVVLCLQSFLISLY